ncbi:MAG: hypothetical protein GX616_02285 [Planctomycetes bacterium]|nr:hypothetical protein [Planctomycetota bacterium]
MKDTIRYRQNAVLGVRCLLGLLLISLCCAGCATYEPIRGTYRDRAPKILVDLPDGWLRFNPGRPDYVMTKDGLRLEKIVIRVTRMNKKIKGTDRVYREDMLPQEIAELTLGLIRQREEYVNLEVDQIELAQVAGREAYKATAVYTHGQGLHKRMCIYGVPISGYVCEFAYEAAADVYYDRYWPVFERLVGSVRTY